MGRCWAGLVKGSAAEVKEARDGACIVCMSKGKGWIHIHKYMIKA